VRHLVRSVAIAVALAGAALPKESRNPLSFCAAAIPAQKLSPLWHESADRDTGTTEGLLTARVKQSTLCQIRLHKTRPGSNTGTRKRGKKPRIFRLSN
jgi:hypothetical protein